jgi:enamine deaminase RidA (YjgF/YER057c/UK114 family)
MLSSIDVLFTARFRIHHMTIPQISKSLKASINRSTVMFEDNLNSRGISLRTPPPGAGSYLPVMKAGNLVFISGQLPFEGGTLHLPNKYVGKVAVEVSIEIAQHGARQCTINAIAQLKAFFSTLEIIKKFVRVNGYVNCEPTFVDHPRIINGASDLLVDIFGERGSHSRVALGVSSLPFGSVVEVDFVCEV